MESNNLKLYSFRSAVNPKLRSIRWQVQQKLAKRNRLNRQNLNRILSAQSVPKINTVGSILNGPYLQLAVIKLEEPIKMRVK